MNIHIESQEDLVLRKVTFDARGCEWCCTVAFEDMGRLNPISMEFYVWELGEPRVGLPAVAEVWPDLMAECLEKALGYSVKVTSLSAAGRTGVANVARATALPEPKPVAVCEACVFNSDGDMYSGRCGNPLPCSRHP